MSKSENKALKRATVKCHGKFKTNLKVNAGKDEVVIEFIANQDTVDLNVLGRMLKDGATAIFVSDQTDKDKGKEAPGQLSLLKGSGN